MPATASKQADAARAKSDGIQTTVVLPADNEGAALPHVPRRTSRARGRGHFTRGEAALGGGSCCGGFTAGAAILA